ncbi:sugar ABC transporter ATP-binding protein [Thalassococcus sp. S3]|uniref:sugar ABC transporter ATP-binding protein n=1 Tax=Thalassococcus sp. S3 TaxID=2017482 RepID=UPI0020C2F083|nr:sugar ABC transporter ATP-binding protein [Thalassococcus sp. S3]
MTKDYPGVRALDGVDFDLRAGEVHILFGENGAGKSTLISMLSGANTPSAGQIERDGKPVTFHSVHDARAHGVSAVFQEFSLIPQMTVEENLFLGAEHCRGLFLDRADMRREAKRIIEELAFDLQPQQKVEHLSRAEQQMVEIAKAFRSDLSVLILDEPTASLTDHETDQLFKIIGDLTARGVGIIYITHRMSEIRRIGDRITVLRDGKYIDTISVEEADEDRLVELMTGRNVGAIFPVIDHAPGDEEILRLDQVTTTNGRVLDVSLNVRRGEILGLAGLVGSGKSEATQAAFGAVQIASGEVFYKGATVTGQSPAQAVRSGFLYLPADRHDEGLLMVRPVRENISIAALDVAPFRRGPFMDRAGERRTVSDLAQRLNLSPNQPERAVDHFSGGNQQKVMLARSLTRPVDLVIFDEPTVGVDVGTRQAIYQFIVELSMEGTAIVIVSSDLPEILNLTSRAYVFYRGRIQAELCGDALTEENVLANFFEKETA